MRAEIDRELASGPDPFRAHRDKPANEHLADWIRSLAGSTEIHADDRQVCVSRFFVHAAIASIAEITADRARDFLASLRKLKSKRSPEGLSVRTLERHQSALTAFTKWLAAGIQARLPADPLAGLPGHNVRANRVRERRPLTVAERDRLIEGSAHDASIAYRMSAYTGLRRGELGKLRVRAIDFARSVIQPRAGEQKARREDEIPLAPSLAVALKAHIARKKLKAGDLLFPPDTIPEREDLAADFARADIPLVDENGDHADFHSLRATYGTELARAGVLPHELMRLMRLSSVELAMRYYVRAKMHDLASAVARLDERSQIRSQEGRAATDVKGLPRTQKKPRKPAKRERAG